ncbi:hypothetical protein DRE_03894 [Drechslerella stenobrocha 248]|uniref:Deacetylase sirtuin-type domain-containing protein n=1 Tax=Drechslerella stenobrocha 248 TaxID=1043628 RepID=W7I3B2_9PEZI|nr:hypothetical protein DRE_03894 [Drechslerella stenobrocha 248]
MPYLEHNPADLARFKAHLSRSRRILALCGAGLSASSGLATFRGAGGLWKTHDAMSLATPQAFTKDPSLVWQFYSARRQAAFSAKPNPAHRALAALSIKNKDFITVTQNVDGLSPRSGHPAGQLFPVHGSLSTVKCTGVFCNYVEFNNFDMALTPALAPSSVPSAPSTDPAAADPDAQPPNIPLDELPKCSKCSSLLRPGVVWFGETLPKDLVKSVNDWINAGPIDLCLVIGTSGRVWPAAGYIQRCEENGAKVAIINMDIWNDPELGGVAHADWLFEGDCATILPEILEPIIGNSDQVAELLGNQDSFPPKTTQGGPAEASAPRSGEGTGYY